MVATKIFRKLGEPTVFYDEGQQAGDLYSAEDILMSLGRGTPRYGYSIYAGKRVLPPGYALYSVNGEHQVRREWTPLNGPTWQDTDESIIAKSIREKVMKIVAAQARDYKKVGLFLSGGLDSTILAYCLQQSGVEVVGYVCRFPEFPETDETAYADLAARAFALPLRIVDITKDFARTALDEINTVADRPVMCWSAISQLAVSRRAAEDGCELLFSGLGSDELFAGFSLMGRKYKVFQDHAEKAGPENTWKALLGEASDLRTSLLFIGNASPFPRQLLEELFEHKLDHAFLEQDVVEYYRDLHTKYPDLDIAAMMCAWEMEVRTSEMLWPDFATAAKITGVHVVYPFFDKELLDWFSNIPMYHRFKFNHVGSLKYFPLVYNGIDKYILRLAFQEDIPIDTQKRERMAFTAPFAWWLGDTAYRNEILGVIKQSVFWHKMGLKKDMLDKLFASDEKPNLLNQWNWAFQIFQLYMITRWMEKNDKTNE